MLCILQFSFRTKEKYDRRQKSHRPGPGLGELGEEHDFDDSNQSFKLETDADVDRYMEQMLVSVIHVQLS